MGYRQYFLKVNKEKIEKIRNFNLDELLTFAEENNIEVVREEDWCSFHDILKLFDAVHVFAFGKYYENANEIYKLGKPLFRNKDLQECFEDYSPYVVTKEAVECAIDWQRQHILKYFNNLLLDDEEYQKIEIYDTRPKLERLESAVREKIVEWTGTFIKPYNLDNDKNHCIVNSWLYEYTIFDLVRIYRDTDWDNECLIFYGY